MSRWIDAEWIRNVYADFEHYENREDWTTPIANVLAVIDDAPSIDIVRCKECKKAFNVENEWICNHLSGMVGLNVVVNADDFCSYGERAEQTEPNSSEKPNNCDEPQTDKHKCRRCVYYDVSSDYYPCVSCIDYSNYTGEITDCAWK